MKFLCFGVGAIGTYIGGSLALQGHQVIFLERPELVEGLIHQGLTLEIDGKKNHFHTPQVVGSLSEALSSSPLDAGILAVKAFDTSALADSLKNYRNDLPPILCLQNGVENELMLEIILGAGRVIAGTVTTAIGRKAPGEIVVERLRGTGIADGNPESRKIEQAFLEAGLLPRLYANGRGMKWSKMLTNLMGNATSAILDMTPGEIYGHKELYRMEILQLKETLCVMRAMNIPVVDLPGTPVRLLRWIIERLPARLSQPLLRQAVGGGRGNKMPSFHIDLHAGRKQSEVEYLNGAVVRFGQKNGVPTPVNEILTKTLIGLVTGELSISDFAHNPQRLFER